MGSFSCTGWQIGGIVGFWINYGVSENLPSGHKQWLIPFAVQLIPGGLFAIGIPLVIKESPRWLISRGRRDEAVRNLCYMRKLEPTHPYIIEEGKFGSPQEPRVRPHSADQPSRPHLQST